MSGVTGKPELMKQMNTTLLYRTFMRLRSATRAEVANETGLSATTIRTLFEELLSEGELLPLALDQSSGGRRAQRYILNPLKNLILTLYQEQERERLVYQISNLVGEVVKSGYAPIEASEPGEAVLHLIGDYLGKGDIRAVGLGVPGIVENGRYYTGSELGTLVANDIGERIRRTFPVLLTLENDLNAVALGYRNRYAAAHPTCNPEDFNMAYIHFNRTNAGAGMIVNGQVVHGAKRFAGELGFLPMEGGRTLNERLPHVSSREGYLEIVSQVISIVNCVTNPELIVFGGDLFEEAWFQYALAKLNSQTDLAGPLRPDFLFCPDCREDYLAGLTALTLDELVPLLPLAPST